MSARSRSCFSAVMFPTALLVCLVFGVYALPARAGERVFVVTLANSPKQYPGPDRDPPGQPAGGLVNRQLIHQQYFDRVDPEIGSFAEYWEEISYGDVTIRGTTTDWINLPWAIQPPLVDPSRDDPLTGPPIDDDLTDPGLRTSPANFYDLNRSGEYEYGHGEWFDNTFAALVIDRDGDPNGNDNGPYVVGPGSLHKTAPPFSNPVWKPGERFVDMDDDGRWDGLDEANNQMDWDRDGAPDLLGPWVDLNENAVGDNPSDCVFLPDSDNDGNPDCCPNGPGRPGCMAYDPDAALSPAYKGACPPTRWTGPNGTVRDCNGNLIPDACDLSCTSQACQQTGWLESPMFIDTNLLCASDLNCRNDLGFSCDPTTGTCRLCGASRDDLPFTRSGESCVPLPDNVPDECQFAVLYYPNPIEGCVEELLDDHHPCWSPLGGQLDCVRQVGPGADSLVSRCEFDDADEDGELDLVEPFENFLRRWDPCVYDPDVSPDNVGTIRAHWIKVFDPNSPNAQESLECETDGRTVRYGDDSYIRHNYPARGGLCSRGRTPCDVHEDCPDPGEVCRTGVEELIAEAGNRDLYGSHDPAEKLAAENAPCICTTLPCESADDCAGFSKSAICAGLIPCLNPFDCGSVDPAGCFVPPGNPTAQRYCRGHTFCACASTETVSDVCPAGSHRELDPPDRWVDVVALNGPGGTSMRTTKMQTEPNIGLDPGLLEQITPKPGTYVSPVTNEPIDEPWYEQAWSDRYNGSACPNPDFDPSEPVGVDNTRYVACECDNPEFDADQPEGAENSRTIACEPPAWPGDTQPALSRNVPRVVPFDDIDPETYDPRVDRRFFHANAGGLNGDGTGWVGCDSELDPYVRFETGEFQPSFETLCDSPILPEEVDGVNEPGIFYDGWVEHDDLPSSKYHRAGDQRLGEITSPLISAVPFSPHGSDPQDPPDPIEVPAIWGQDLGVGKPSPYGSDGIVPAAGPYAVDIHGNFGRDAGNLLSMELLTWRTEPPFNNGAVWVLNGFPDGYMRFHPFAGPYTGPNLGFRDYNLDGLIDQGEVRPAGSENYIADSVNGTADDGFRSAYPFNRRRLMEDVVEIIDAFVDFDDLSDADALARVTCPDGAVSETVPLHLTEQPNDAIFAGALCSGTVLLPRNSHTPTDFLIPFARYTAIHNEDGSDPDAALPRPAGPAQLHWDTFFHNLVRGIDVEFVDNVIPVDDFQTAFAAHMYLHIWENFPDLYDYDIFQPPPASPINCPVGEWDVMARGGLVHPNPALKEQPCTDWMTSIDLTTVLVPGVESVLTIPPVETTRSGAAYFLENYEPPFGPRERFYFWSVGRGFDARMPGEGLLIGHGVRRSYLEPFPFLPVEWEPPLLIVQADGLDELDAGTDCGDDGDPWPGSSGNTVFTCDTYPASRWYLGDQCTGLDVLDIEPAGYGSTEVRLRWLPMNLPSLRFVHPPGGQSVPLGDKVRYLVEAAVNDLFGGTSIRFFYVMDGLEPVVDPDGGNYIGVFRTVIPGVKRVAVDWNIAGVEDGVYRLFAELIPGEGADGVEPSHTVVHPGLYNVGNGALTVEHVDVNEVVASGDDGFFPTNTTFAALDALGEPVDFSQFGVRAGDKFVVDEIVADPTLRTVSAIASDGTSLSFVPPVDPLPAQTNGRWKVVRSDRAARLEAWHVECIDHDGTEWVVTSSLTQPYLAGAAADRTVYPLAFTGIPYTSIGGEVGFVIDPGDEPFAAGDTFVFTTTGITALSGPVLIRDGSISQDPAVVVAASPRVGTAPLEVTFDAGESFDLMPGELEYRWEFGDGSPSAYGSEVVHVFEDPGLYTAQVRVTNTYSARFDEASITIVVRERGARLGDWNGNLAIDLEDYAQLAHCLNMSGPEGAPSDAECVEFFDFDDDWDVDLGDYDRFRFAFATE